MFFRNTLVNKLKIYLGVPLYVWDVDAISEFDNLDDIPVLSTGENNNIIIIVIIIKIIIIILTAIIKREIYK